MYSKLQNHVKTNKPKPVIWFLLENGLWLVLILLMTMLAIYIIQIFSYHLNLVWSFRGFFLSDGWGFLWLTFPEALIGGVLLFVIAGFLYRQKDFWGYKQAEILTGIIIFLVITITLISGNFFKTQNYVWGTYDDLATSGYRLKVRDLYVQKMDSNLEYYGVLVASDNVKKEIIINHGGVLHSFMMKNDISLQTKDLIWVKYIWQDGIRVIQDMKKLS